MNKNEIVARWLGFKIWYKNGSDVQVEISLERCIPINEWRKLDHNLLHEAWVKFRDLKFDPNTNIQAHHEYYCQQIRYAVMMRTINAAFDELVKGIEWYESLKK